MNKVPTTMDSFRVEEQEGVEKDLNPKEEGPKIEDTLNEATANENKVQVSEAIKENIKKNPKLSKREQSVDRSSGRSVKDEDLALDQQQDPEKAQTRAKSVEFTGPTFQAASEVVDSVQFVSESAVNMINFTIELTKREKLIDEEVEEEEEVPTANVSNEDCGCVCHPGNCTCKADSVAYVKKDFMLDENERACKCLLRRIQKEQELYGTSLSPVQEETKRKPCIDSCVCHCHKNEEKKDFDVADKCIGTCTVHCPNHEHRPSKADDNKPGQKSFAGKPSGDEKESEQIWSNQKYDNEENPNANHAAGPENEKKDGKTTRPSDVRRASTITGGSIFKRLSNSIRRSK